jgi:16S rRNA (guanine966-N2)-methyltransferase
MRIVAGAWGGRRIHAPPGVVTRPTSDRVREAVFSMVAARWPDRLAGAVLDLFAGTGALGLEALSRGARSAVFVESDRRALESLRRNVGSLGAEAAHILAGDAFALVGAVGARGPYSLLLLDPPYRIEAARVGGLVAEIAPAHVEPGAIAVWEHASTAVPQWPPSFEVVSEKRYGDTTVSAARFAESE